MLKGFLQTDLEFDGFFCGICHVEIFLSGNKKKNNFHWLWLYGFLYQPDEGTRFGI